METNIPPEEVIDMPIDNIKDHDLLISLNVKVDNLTTTLASLVDSMALRGAAIDELKTRELLSNKEHEQHLVEFKELASDVHDIKTKVEVHGTEIENLKTTSILLWSQKHPKATWALIGAFLIVLNFHDLVIPYLLSLVGIKMP